jgi:hypothetical protein
MSSLREVPCQWTRLSYVHSPFPSHSLGRDNQPTALGIPTSASTPRSRFGFTYALCTVADAPRDLPPEIELCEI